ncbi:(deoxy)nucleoside triphosphate pyrophosphohydrolase [uncultured Methanobrevibacter sp.]|uniref:(deoxy)nucleoside triphosphate pyrophosphohydrolase n=1 Tax=uncultured Methanobrevibacter sp. TaxID=253161 RepID=UPI0025F374F5|nr:(deoxy)nucleoside triphosphate pyrophosphohydrolase [uncultured Methanobrevibacter sp.]
MKKTKVVAAIIRDKDKILATQRGYGEYKGYWEFPGGKIENSESNEEALIREIKEELNGDIEIKKFALNIKFQYPKFFLDMDCYECKLNGEIELLEHMNSKWLSKEELDSVEWLPADIDAVNYLKNIL